MPFPHEPARTDPGKLLEVREDLLAAADVLDEISALTDGMDEFTPALNRRIRPDEDSFADVRMAIFSLKKALSRHASLRESAENPTYLGNVAVARYPEELSPEQ